MVVFWVVVPCGLVGACQCFRGTYDLRSEDGGDKKLLPLSLHPCSFLWLDHVSLYTTVFKWVYLLSGNFKSLEIDVKVLRISRYNKWVYFNFLTSASVHIRDVPISSLYHWILVQDFGDFSSSTRQTLGHYFKIATTIYFHILPKSFTIILTFVTVQPNLVGKASLNQERIKHIIGIYLSTPKK
jgi:hypothetical protein